MEPQHLELLTSVLANRPIQQAQEIVSNILNVCCVKMISKSTVLEYSNIYIIVGFGGKDMINQGCRGMVFFCWFGNERKEAEINLSSNISSMSRY